MSNILFITELCWVGHALILLPCVCIFVLLSFLYIRKSVVSYLSMQNELKFLTNSVKMMQMMSEELVKHSADFEKDIKAKSFETQQLMLQAKEREQFMTVMGHQIRTSLNIILGLAQVLSDSDTHLSPEDVAGYGEELSYNSDRLMKIIEDVLTMTLLDNTNVRLSLKMVSLRNAVDTSVNTIDNLLKKMECSVEVKSGITDVEVYADELYLGRVIDNLLDNACRFSSIGSKIYVWWEDNTDNTVSLYVQDHGCGISPEYHERIFHRFFKVNPYSQGVGLGLTLAKAELEKMGGSISVESKEDEGSTFILNLLKDRKE